MIQYLVSCRIKEGYYDEAIEFIHTLQAYYPGSTLYADEFGPVNLIYLMIPFESLASYEDRVDCLRNDAGLCILSGKELCGLNARPLESGYCVHYEGEIRGSESSRILFF